MLEFARWKYTLVAVVTLLALIIAAPNFFGEDVAVQVARKDRAPIDDTTRELVEATLKDKGVNFKRSFVDNGRLMVLFDEVGQQLAGRDAVNATFRDSFDSALARAPRAPGVFRALGLRPMPLGLDLRGGLYLLYEVDVKGAVRQLVEAYEQDYRRALTTAKIDFSDATPVANGVRVTFAPGTDLDEALVTMRRAVPDVTYTTSGGATPYIDATLTDAQVRERQRGAIEQNMITLGNRVNALGVTEPIVQQQGADRIAVQLPGVTNSAQVKSMLGRTASLEFRLTDMVNSANEAATRGRAPLGSRLDYHRDGRPTLLKRELIATGENLIGATTAVTQDGPSVQIRLDSKGGDEMRRVSMSNIGRLMAVVLVEKTREQYTDPATGELRERNGPDRREVISEATIRGVLGNNFNITGLSQAEASELALLMRSGQLAAPLLPVSERPVGPSLGQENIKSGVQALMWGAGLLFIFMIFYYHLFGVVACVVLTVNMVLLTALLSLLGASLSLPGIAGILLTVGMAVDANVIIYERVREELRNGVSPQTSIRAGFEKAWSAIWDSNVTTFIAGLVLWVFGTGPIRNFAVVLSLGILTSMFTAMLGSRALLTLIYGGARKPARLSIG
ncbi:MAG TPA: protein translocase subunit SecD [Steroidobacteraceae bacterium]|nr:protein translocase subunit SecD [Steroidobacteraceae bacterium]